MKEIKNQIIAAIGLIITAAAGVAVSKIEAFLPAEEPEQQEIIEEQPEIKKDTIVVIEKKAAPVEKKKEFEW
jgi:hypothetical protein